tara:strand:+ start:247 stop:528 length:282 start_codon:yes stop_codon:yes gene_type:complete
MKKHVKMFMDYWDISTADVTPCFACEGEYGVIVDVHHLQNRASGGDPKGLKDRPDNLIGLCRRCHTLAEHKKHYNDFCQGLLNEKILRKTYGG